MAYHGKPINEINGGTAQTAYTTGDIIYANNTNALARLGIGSSGTVLTSDGSVPSWQTGMSPSPSFSVTTLYDDMFPYDTAFANSTLDVDDFPGTGIAYVNHPGVVGNSTQDASLISKANFFLSDGSVTFYWIVNVSIASTATHRYFLNIGVGDTYSVASAEFNDGVYFYYRDNVNSGNWQIKTAKAGSRTATNTAVAATGWQVLSCVINAAGTSATFSINGSAVGTIATNLPVVGLQYANLFVQDTGTISDNSELVDLFYGTQTLTTPRG